MPKADVAISILITVIGGKETMRRCLQTLLPQTQTVSAEIIVPYDEWANDIGELKAEFSDVNFPFITDLGMAADPNVPAHQHRLCDRRRAIGLDLARGQIIAMTEDQVVPAENWVAEILAAHNRLPDAVIGGSIDNAVDEPIHWAAYYCDHGRYGSPLQATEAEYISDLNISYKRAAIESTRDVWGEAYSETMVHWALRDRGMTLRLEPALKVFKHRPPINYRLALAERAEWGRVFAETRVASVGLWRRIFFAAMTPALPALLLLRNLTHMLRQRRTVGQIVLTLPLSAGLLLAWSCGELVGYVLGEPQADALKPVADWNA
ncbi:MAG: glycosyltransferase family 2 protein [Blastocatellia bacterium]